MKNKFQLLIALILLAGCTPQEGITQLTDEEKQIIISEYDDLNNKLSEKDLSEMTAEDLNQIISEAQDYPMIEKIWVENMTLMVKFKRGGVVGWLLDKEFIIPPYIGDMQSNTSSEAALCFTKSSNAPSNKEVCLINCVYNDQRNDNARDIINRLQQILQMCDYNVTIKNGTEVNKDFISNDLNKYGIIFYIGHGVYDAWSIAFWLQTGEEAGANPLSRLFERSYPSWTNNEVAILTSEETRGGILRKVSYYYINDRFINNVYRQNSFPNSIFYSVACQTMKHDSFWKTLISKGVGVVIGWTEPVSISPSTGYLLFQTLLCGWNVQNAFTALPKESKTDSCKTRNESDPPYKRSYLVYRPSEAGDMSLTQLVSTSVNLTSPENGKQYGSRVINLTGSISGFETITSSIVEVNGTAFILSLSNNSTFNQFIAIKKGDNNIKISCYGTTNNNRMATATKEINVTGNFNTIPLFTQLRWNTSNADIDLHLLRPNYGLNFLCSSYDCYYGNKNTSWGAYLDVDDRYGNGPEHITIPADPQPGLYTLVVHYYTAHGDGATDATVAVSTYNNTVHTFGPYRLNSDDLWEVCTISLPDGTITPINRTSTKTKTSSAFMGNEKKLPEK